MPERETRPRTRCPRAFESSFSDVRKVNAYKKAALHALLLDGRKGNLAA